MRQNSLLRTYRRLRYGEPIFVVSGLPRSGTSMAMKMLAAGGIETVTDGERHASSFLSGCGEQGHHTGIGGLIGRQSSPLAQTPMVLNTPRRRVLAHAGSARRFS